jgi:metallopeptidase MepB
VALSRTTNKFVLVVFFVAIFTILASLRLGVRPPSIVQYLKLSPLRTSFRPLTNSTMSPRTPPQLPPRFTATKESLIEDTKRLIDRSRGVQDAVVRDVKLDSAKFADVILPIARDDNKMSIESVSGHCTMCL